MTEANMENLSAAMDGELSREELRFLLRRVDHDASLLKAWTRYHLASEGLRGLLPAMASHGFASRVMAAIEGEAAGRSPIASSKRGWLRLSVGGAIAASVAAAALLVSQPPAPDIGPSPQLAGGGSANASQGAQARAWQGQANRGAGAAQLARHDILAAAPPSLSPYSPSALSQPASVTLGNPADNPLFQRYRRQNYSMQGYKTVDGPDGSYLLLIDSSQAQPAAAPEAR